MNQQAMMRQIKKLQQEMLDTQQEIEQTEFTKSVGPVTILMLGNKEMKKITIDPNYNIEDADDLAMLEDSIVATQNGLISEIDKYTEEKMGKYRSMLGGF